MANGVFTHRADSVYTNTPAARYHFHKRYLGRVRACLDDWIIYYEPVTVRGARGYWAVARVEHIVGDPERADLFYAVIEPASFFQFTDFVPFAGHAGPIEHGLLNTAGKLSGRAQAAVRRVSYSDFARIVNTGFSNTMVLPRDDFASSDDYVSEDYVPIDYGDRRRVTQLVSRSLRKAAFRTMVLSAYSERCALTGWKLIDAAGRAEVQAAHIQPVAAHGPDMVANGLALAGTIHWMFDRGLITLADDLSILISRQLNDRNGLDAVINPTGKARLPLHPGDRPHPQFLRWHRDNCFKA